MKVAIVSGICVFHDAISNAVVEQACLIRGLPEVESVLVATQHCERPIDADRVIQVADAWSLLRQPEIQQADVIIFHWGIAYDLFDAIVVLEDHRRVIVHFHNVTPVQLVEATQSRIIERSLQQIEALSLNHCRIWADSVFNEQTLHDWGINPSRIQVIAFPIEAPELERTPRGERVRLLTVGRLVSAKGTDVLIDAIDRHVQRHGFTVELRLVGNLQLSDGAFIDGLRRMIADARLDEVVTFIDGPTDDELWRQYEWADVVVTPSFHEGLCVPIIEGYLAGCRTVATTAGNLPNIVFPPDILVAPGDSVQLAGALAAMVRQIRDGQREPSVEARAVASRYRRSAVIDSMRSEFLLIQNPRDRPQPSHAADNASR